MKHFRTKTFGPITLICGNMQSWFEHRYGLPMANMTRIAWDFKAAEDVAELAVMIGEGVAI